MIPQEARIRHGDQTIFKAGLRHEGTHQQNLVVTSSAVASKSWIVWKMSWNETKDKMRSGPLSLGSALSL